MFTSILKIQGEKSMNSLKLNRITAAIIETERFIATAYAWKDRIEKNKFALISGSKEGATCKRASMDLTRSLAELRKP